MVRGISSIAGGSQAQAVNNNTFVWSDGHGGAFASTSTNQFLIHASGGFCVGTNSAGTNQAYFAGTLACDNLSVDGTNLFAEMSALSAAVNFYLNFGSNALQSQITYNSNLIYSTSNSLAATVTTTSNALQAQIGSAAMKAFTATLPSTYASIGVAFSTPLMPDGNYSVSLTPSDQQTADSIFASMHWWVDSKSTSGFTLHTDYATNYNLNFECIVKKTLNEKSFNHNWGQHYVGGWCNSDADDAAV